MALNLKQYDGFEVGWNVILIGEDGSVYYDFIGTVPPQESERTEHPSRYVCTVYGHLPGHGGVEWLCDCPTEEIADEIVMIFERERTREEVG